MIHAPLLAWPGIGGEIACFFSDFTLRVKGLRGLTNRKIVNFSFNLFRLRRYLIKLLFGNFLTPTAPFSRIRPSVSTLQLGASITSRAFIFAALLIIAACGKNESDIETLTPSAETSAANAPASEPSTPGDLLPTGFPLPTADFEGNYDMGVAGKSAEVTITGSGGRQRIAFPPGSGAAGSASPWSQVMVSENNGEKMLMWPEGAGAPKIAATLSRRDVAGLAVSFGVDAEKAARGKKTGDDTIAGEKCTIWEIEAEEGSGETPGTVCVTKDGIILRAISGGQTVLLAKSIKRGRQDVSRFAPPSDYEVADMGECMRIGAEAMEMARAGKMPDMAKMEKCRVLGEKMGAMFGQ